MRPAALAMLLAVAALDVPAVPPRWLHNPRERTATAIESWRHRDYAAADKALEEALELGGETPRGLFNAGTGRLGTGTPGAALPLLSRAARAAEGDPAAQALRPEALYNLGNAYLAAGDPATAAESYRAALRLRPDHAAAKHNLELALRELQRKQQEQQQEQQRQQQGGKGKEGGGGGGGADRQAAPQGQNGPQQGGPPQQAQPQPQGASGQAQQRDSRLPGFNPQKDMSASQAAALLEAVENLEREQRRAQAEQQRLRRARSASEKDW